MATTLPPPQAYTRDVLAAAYEWLRSQPQSIRELATNSDNLVALYMQARRRPAAMSQITEASSEAFKQDLRNLAEGFKQFEDPRVVQVQAQQHATPQPTMREPMAAPAVQPQQTVRQNLPAVQDSAGSLDSRTLEIIRKVQNLCNLGSEREALRMLVSIGFERVREIFSRDN